MIETSRREVLAIGALAAMGLLSLPRVSKSEIVADFSAASTRFGLDLLNEIAKQSGVETNLVISPASIMAAFSLVDIGAGTELHAVLGKLFHLDGAADLNGLRRSLAALILGRDSNGPVSGFDAVYVDKAIVLKQTAAKAFKAIDARVESRHLADPDVAKEINALVKKATRGAIQSIIEAPLTGSGIVLVNALYFKDVWRHGFSVGATQSADFHLAAGGRRHAPMMHADARLLSAAEKGAFAAVKLPYRMDGYSLILVVNREKPAQLAEFAPCAGWLAGVGLEDYNVTLSLPRFSFKGGGDVLTALDGLGLAPARSQPGPLAGFSDTPLQIAAVPHKVAIVVDEGGTTAAAATGVIAPTASAPPSVSVQSLDFVADKPFMFALHDDNIGSTLMVGYVGDPAKTS